MSDTFWSHCRRAIDQHGAGNLDGARRLLDSAEQLLHEGTPDETMLTRRRRHLSALRSHFEVAAATVGAEAAAAVSSAEVGRLHDRIDALEADKRALRQRLQSMPSIDPLCLVDGAAGVDEPAREDFGIVVFGHTRLDELDAVLESLRRQDALRYTEVWLDGHQGSASLKPRVQKTIELVQRYPVKALRQQNGQFAFRKMMILGLSEMSRRYRDILVLEDDCFPTRDAVEVFRAELDAVRDDPRVFSVYGHHFLTDSERPTCTRFQGWGWATTAEKLRPVLRQLIDCYSMTEERYLEFVRLALTADIRARIDVTPPRQPTHTLERFFAWDETLCLLTAMNGQVHRPTPKRTIFNCGMSKDSTHFGVNARFRAPPYNLIAVDEVWQHF